MMDSGKSSDFDLYKDIPKGLFKEISFISLSVFGIYLPVNLIISFSISVSEYLISTTTVSPILTKLFFFYYLLPPLNIFFFLTYHQFF